MEMNEYQQAAVLTQQPPAKEGVVEPIVSLLGLVGEAGVLVSEYKKYLRDGDAHQLFPERVREELGDILWYIASVADHFSLDLETIAQSNLEKTCDRWGDKIPGELPSFDVEFPDSERLPRQFEVVLETVTVKGKAITRMFMGGILIGNPMTDNSYQDDGYRFHDIFHLSCAAYLGWSPVIRKLLGRKRKSQLHIDEIEDGGRATAIEEGISALVFSYAANHNLLKKVDKIDFELLRTIKGMTKSLEVHKQSYRQWEMTILGAYSIWREVQQRNGGTLMIDLDARSITVKP